MIYAVDKYMDWLKLKDKRETVPGFSNATEPKYHYFDTEREARDFIRKRAQDGVRKAEHALDKAIARSRRCYKKFPPIKLTEPSPPATSSGT